MMIEDVLTLVASAASGTKGTDVFVGHLRARPVEQVAVIVYGGAEASYAMGAASAVARRPRFQVVVRSANQSTAWTKAEAVRAALDWYAGTTGGTTFGKIVAVGDLVELPPDGVEAYTVAGSYEATIL